MADASDEPPEWFFTFCGACLIGVLGLLGWCSYRWIAEPDAEPQPQTLCERFAGKAAEKLWTRQVRSTQYSSLLTMVDSFKVEITADRSTAVEKERAETDLGPVVQCTVTVTAYRPSNNTTETAELDYAVEPRADGKAGWYVRIL